MEATSAICSQELLKVVLYCGTDCQVEHWRVTHHKQCKMLTKPKKAETEGDLTERLPVDMKHSPIRPVDTPPTSREEHPPPPHLPPGPRIGLLGPPPPPVSPFTNTLRAIEKSIAQQTARYFCSFSFKS